MLKGFARGLRNRSVPEQAGLLVEGFVATKIFILPKKPEDSGDPGLSALILVTYPGNQMGLRRIDRYRQR